MVSMKKFIINDRFRKKELIKVKNKISLFNNYYKDIHFFNIPFSLIVGCLGVMKKGSVIFEMMDSFTTSMFSGGLLLSLYFFNTRYSNQYYFYINKGLSKWFLLLWCFSINFIIFIIYVVIKSNIL